MAKQIKENTTLYTGTSTWINKETGEEITTTDIVKKVTRSGFRITYLSFIINLFDELGGKKYKVISYILDNMDMSSNILVTTVDKLVQKTKVSKPTVIETLKLLENAKLITRTTGAIMLNPELIHRGSAEKEKLLLTRFEEFGE